MEGFRVETDNWACQECQDSLDNRDLKGLEASTACQDLQVLKATKGTKGPEDLTAKGGNQEHVANQVTGGKMDCQAWGACQEMQDEMVDRGQEANLANRAPTDFQDLKVPVDVTVSMVDRVQMALPVPRVNKVAKDRAGSKVKAEIREVLRLKVYPAMLVNQAFLALLVNVVCPVVVDYLDYPELRAKAIRASEETRAPRVILDPTVYQVFPV